MIEVQEDGTVLIAGNDMEWTQKALNHVEALTATVQVGRIYTGTVNSIREFGAFLEILPGRDGLCHVSEIADGYIENVADYVKIGDEFQVQVIEVDDHGRIKLSRRRAFAELGLEDPLAEQIKASGAERPARGERREGSREGSREGNGGPRRDGGRREGGRDGGGRDGGRRDGGRPRRD